MSPRSRNRRTIQRTVNTFWSNDASTFSTRGTKLPENGKGTFFSKEMAWTLSRRRRSRGGIEVRSSPADRRVTNSAIGDNRIYDSIMQPRLLFSQPVNRGARVPHVGEPMLRGRRAAAMRSRIIHSYSLLWPSNRSITPRRLILVRELAPPTNCPLFGQNYYRMGCLSRGSRRQVGAKIREAECALGSVGYSKGRARRVPRLGTALVSKPSFNTTLHTFS